MSVITKVHALRGNVNNAIDYILNPDKTEDCLTGTNMGVVPEHVGMFWKSKWKEDGFRGTKVGYHFIQSFDDPNLTPEQIYELAEEWIKDCTHGEHDYVIAVHKNTKHTHAHIIVNPVNNISKKGWDIYYKRDLPVFRELNDQMCRKYGLEVLPKPERGSSIGWWNHQNQKKADNDIEVIRKTIDYIIPKVKNYDDFKSYLNKISFTVEDGSENITNEKKDTDKYKDYKFTVAEKLVNKDLSNDQFYFVRIPYSRDWMLIDKQNAKWNDKGNILECHVDFTKSYNIYNSSGSKVIDYDRNGIDIARQWEDKTKTSKGRQGLRIKPPYKKKFRRTKNIHNTEDESLDYSLEGIKKRIEENGREWTDSDIEEIIEDEQMDQKKQKELRNTFYDNANIKTSYNQSALYQMTKKEKFYYFKTSELQKKLDMIAERKSSFENLNNLDEMKILKKEIKRELAKCNSHIRDIEASFEDIQIQRMEGIIEMSDEEVSNILDKDLPKLRHESTRLKKQYSDVTSRIKNAEKDKDRFR